MARVLVLKTEQTKAEQANPLRGASMIGSRNITKPEPQRGDMMDTK